MRKEERESFQEGCQTPFLSFFFIARSAPAAIITHDREDRNRDDEGGLLWPREGVGTAKASPPSSDSNGRRRVVVDTKGVSPALIRV